MQYAGHCYGTRTSSLYERLIIYYLTGHSGKSDGPGRRARFNHPHGIVADPFGNLFVCDYFNHTIRKIDSKGEVTTVAGVPGRKGMRS